MCKQCDNAPTTHSVDNERGFPVYPAVTFALCSVLFTWCAFGAADVDKARNLPPAMDGGSDHGQAAREAAAAEVKRVCRGKPLQVKVCAEEIRRAHMSR